MPPAIASEPARPQPATGPALSAEGLRGRIVGNTMHRSGTNLGVGWDWAGHYRPDGTMLGRAWWGFGDIDAHGNWRIEGADGCQFWENVDWSEGGWNCYRVYPAGGALFWDHRRGPHVEDWLFDVRPGNAFGLAREEANDGRDGP